MNLFSWMVIAITLASTEGQIHRQKVDESKKLTYLFLAMFLAVLFFCIVYCVKKICPRVDMYSPLELDEIRLERAESREGVLAGKIDRMKDKLSHMRKSRTQVQTRRDIAANIEERVDKFNSKGRDIYGDAWEGKNGAVPIRELVKIPDTEVRSMQLEAQAIVTARKQEEEKDLWDLWNQDDAEEGRGRQAQQNNRSSDGTKENMEEPKVAKLPEPRNSSIKKGVPPPPPKGVKPPPLPKGVKPPPPVSKGGSKKLEGGNSATSDDTGNSSKLKVKVPVHLMKKYPPSFAPAGPPARPPARGPGASGPPVRSTAQRKPPPPPLTPPPSTALKPPPQAQSHGHRKMK